MHEFRRFIQKHLDEQGLRQADLVARSGLTRSHVSKILRDSRDHLGQMPDDGTIEAIARGLTVPTVLVRTAAARSLAGYVDDGAALTIDLNGVPTDTLLNELRRRINANQGDRHDHTSTQTSTSPNPEAGSSTRIGASIVDEPTKTEPPQPVIYRPMGISVEEGGKVVDATWAEQGPSVENQDDYELARRKGETESEWRERTGNDYE